MPLVKRVRGYQPPREPDTINIEGLTQDEAAYIAAAIGHYNSLSMLGRDLLPMYNALREYGGLKKVNQLMSVQRDKMRLRLFREDVGPPSVAEERERDDTKAGS
jgi:hypothetical protein